MKMRLVPDVPDVPVEKVFRKVIVITGILLGLTTAAGVSGQTESPPSPDVPAKKFPTPPLPKLDVYMAPDGKVYAPLARPIFFHISTSPEGEAATSVGRPQEDVVPESLTLKEGKNLLRNKSVTAPVFDVYADGTPPETRPTFPETPQYQSKSKGSYRTGRSGLFVGQNAKFLFERKDALSGVRDTQISVDAKPFISSKNLNFDFSKNHKFELLFYSIDNVGNQEKATRFTFEVDVSAPQTKLSFDGPNYQKTRDVPVVVASATKLVLTAEDFGAGVKKIFYRIDGGKTLPYEKKINIGKLKSGKHILEFSAVDFVENKEVWQKVEFRHDSLPPEVKLLVDGGEFRQDDVVYVSGQAMLHLEFQDDQAGVAETLIRMDEEADRDYIKPFAPPQSAGIHWFQTTITDHVDNQRIFKRKLYIDASPPATDFRLEGASYWNGDTAIIKKDTKIILSSTDLESSVKTLWYCLNNQPCEPYSKPLQKTEDGNYSLVYYAIDYVSNEEKKHTLSFIVDNSPWVVESIAEREKERTHWYFSEKNGLIGAADLEFYLRIADSPDEKAKSYLLSYHPETGEEKKEQQKKTKKTATQKLYFKKGGKNKLWLTLPGLSKHPAWKKLFSIKIDAAAPVTKPALSGAHGAKRNKIQYYGNGLELALSSVDSAKGIQSGVEKIMYSIDGSGFMSYKEPIALFFNEKEYKVRYYAVDRVGNAEKTRTLIFELDQTPPMTNHTVLPPFFGKMLSSQSGIELQSSDGLSGVEKIFYQIDNGTRKIYRKQLTGKLLESLSEGKHTLYYQAVDRVKNLEPVRSLTFSLAHSSPSLSFKIIGEQYQSKKSARSGRSGGTSVAGKTFVARNTKFRLRARKTTTQIAGIRLWIDGKGPNFYRKPFRLPEKPGAHTLAFEVLDKVGNTTPRESRKLFLDLTPPVSGHRLEGKQYRYRGQLFINAQTQVILKSRDSGAGVAKTLYQLGKRKLQRYSKPFRLAESGAYILKYHAVDRVNNVEGFRKTEFFVDSEPPKIKIYAKPAATLRNGKQIIERGTLIHVRTEDPYSGVREVYYSINDGTKTLYRRPISRLRRKGKYTIKIHADDWVQNRNEQTIKFVVQ